MRAIATLGIIILTFGVAVAQTTANLDGRVTHDDRPEKDASVSLILTSDPSVRFDTKTNANGKFTFLGVPPGNYIISARSNPLARPVDFFAKSEIRLEVGENSSIELQLTAAMLPPEIVTVSAGEAQRIDEVSKTVNVIDGQEMRERADFALIDSLRSIPGFRVQQLGGFGKTASIKIRGLRNQDTAILIDGIRFRDAASITGDATPFLSDFTLTSVSRIEVLRGSGSSLYGTNAIGGVIDFQTPTPQPGWHGQVSGAAGGLGLGRFRGNISNLFGDFGFNAAVSRTVYAKGIDGNDDAKNTNFQSRLTYQPLQNTNFSGRFFFSDAFVKLNSNPDTLGNLPPTNFGIIDAVPGGNFVPDADDPDDFQESRFLNGQFVFTQVFGPNVVLQAHYSGLSTSRRNVTGPLGVGFQSNSINIFEGLIHTLNANVEWTIMNANKLTSGYEFEHEVFENDSASPFSSDLSTRAQQRSSTFYVQNLTGLLDGRLHLAGGFRVQSFALQLPTFSTASPLQNISLGDPPRSYTFDGAASYLIRSTGTKIRAHVGNGYRVPSLYERFSSFFGFFTPTRLFLAGAPDLEPERSIAADAAIEQTFANDRLRLSATYFYTQLLNTIGYGLLPQPDRFGRSNLETFGGYQNTKGFVSRGAEFSGRFRPGNSTEIFASYTFTNSDQREPQVSGSGVLRTLGIPDHQFTLVATQRFGRLWINFDLLAASSYLAPIFSTTNFNSYVYGFRGNGRGDLTAGYNFGWKQDRLSLRLFGTIENVFDYEYFENGFRTPGINGRIGLSFGF